MKSILLGLLTGAAGNVGGAAVSILGKLVLNKDFFQWAILKCAEQLVKSTKTKHDDEWFHKIKELLESK